MTLTWVPGLLWTRQMDGYIDRILYDPLPLDLWSMSAEHSESAHVGSIDSQCCFCMVAPRCVRALLVWSRSKCVWWRVPRHEALRWVRCIQAMCS